MADAGDGVSDLVWVRRPPTEPGFYWLRGNPNHSPARVVMVAWHKRPPLRDNDGRVFHTEPRTLWYVEHALGEEWESSGSSHVEHRRDDSEWAGPIPLPMEWVGPGEQPR